MKRWIVLILTTLAFNNIKSAVGCIDDSYHMHREHYFENLDHSLTNEITPLRSEDVRQEDFKAWHYVACTCPCEQYRGYYLKGHTEAKGVCVRCRHRGRSDRTSVQNTETDTEEIARNFALFKQP